ncbi:hypothetical protein O6H91_02G062200 [Diphasiastrum complanatum]|uniref:Uncharacterized protein n=1 Tax=Diphasiastrum complanatum TaxID=34168 RepID=A0ACC2EGG6_DIPCM|nr:hypothetical protein O6H91_02G062200 [Diphasiastrum complanatum]
MLVRKATMRAHLRTVPKRFGDGGQGMSTCRAVVLPRFGGPEVLEVRLNEPIPDLGPSEVLVRTKAAGINPLDLKMRGGYGKSLFKPLLPLILGRDVSDEQLAPKPANLTHVAAAAIPFAALTAWRALHSMAQIRPGQRVLVMGGGGAVGLAAIYLSRALGCQVSCTCGKRSIDLVKEAGADETIDYTSENIQGQFKGQFDAVLDTIGVEETEAAGVNVLKRGGHYLTLQGEAVSLADKYGLLAGGALAAATLLRKQVQYRQSHGIEYWWAIMRTDVEGLHEIARLAKVNKLRIPVGRSFPLTEASEAHRLRENKANQGKVILEAQ